MEIRTMVFVLADLLLAELQKGSGIAEVNIGDKIEIKQNGNSVSLFVGDVEVVTTGEIKNSFLFHHRALQALSFEARGVFSKVVKGADFGKSYIYDIPSYLRFNFPEINERLREGYAHLFQALSWMLRTGAFEWTVA